MRNNIKELLNQRVKSPTPHLRADPFLATRIAAMSENAVSNRNSFKGLYDWSIASLVASCAIIIGVYLGNGLFEEEYETNMISDISSLINQSDYIENLDSVLENGGAQE